MILTGASGKNSYPKNRLGGAGMKAVKLIVTVWFISKEN